MFTKSRRKLEKASSSQKENPTEKVREEPLHSKPYFFGFLPRDDVEPLLEKNGDFLVRKSEHTKEHCSGYCISGISSNKIYHLAIRMNNKGFFAGDHYYKTVSDLIDDAIMKQMITTQKEVFILKTPVIRPDWIINEGQLEFKEKLGEGHFGIVQHATMLISNGDVVDVAVKFLKGKEIPLEERKQFFLECRRFRNLKHRNLVHFFGVSVDTKQVKLIMEYCDITLLEHLKKNRGKFNWKSKGVFCFYASCGMEYIATEGIVHRDLAARNCLLKKGLLKISDFGMAREGGIYKIHSANKPVPIKWTPPDSIRTRVYTEKSDVWSYGVLMWEIFSEGKAPYSEEEELKGDNFVINLIKFLLDGKRLTPPADMPKSLVQVMMECWDLSANNRPTFSTIKKRVEAICKGKDFQD
ncbi:Tyrosine-protein kinase Fps85D [Trichinella pseudospiralis]|uniref:Tyrosine-protein kinase n=1 Tax=Trichinella pseudospiralis TaxID=6337 RepID=A0A0V1EAA4_TRIPS|nr:Tyrosine-protein kinase Fps85D [Trichinella pseudospiralis]